MSSGEGSGHSSSPTIPPSGVTSTPGVTTEFTFGAAPAATTAGVPAPAPTTAPTFGFLGAPPVATAPTSSTGFSFGESRAARSTSESLASPEPRTFSFGTSTIPAPPLPPPSLSFGAAPPTTTAPSFGGFGAIPVAPSASTVTTTAVSPFGAAPAPTISTAVPAFGSFGAIPEPTGGAAPTMPFGASLFGAAPASTTVSSFGASSISDPTTVPSSLVPSGGFSFGSPPSAPTSTGFGAPAPALPFPFPSRPPSPPRGGGGGFSFGAPRQPSPPRRLFGRPSSPQRGSIFGRPPSPPHASAASIFGPREPSPPRASFGFGGVPIPPLPFGPPPSGFNDIVPPPLPFGPPPTMPPAAAPPGLFGPPMSFPPPTAVALSSGGLFGSAPPPPPPAFGAAPPPPSSVFGASLETSAPFGAPRSSDVPPRSQLLNQPAKYTPLEDRDPTTGTMMRYAVLTRSPLFVHRSLEEWRLDAYSMLGRNKGASAQVAVAAPQLSALLEGDAGYRVCIQSLVKSTEPDLSLTGIGPLSQQLRVHRVIVAPFIRAVKRALASRPSSSTEPIALNVPSHTLAELVHLLYLTSLGSVGAGSGSGSGLAALTTPAFSSTSSKPASQPPTVHALHPYKSSETKLCPHCSMVGPSIQTGDRCCSVCNFCEKCCAKMPATCVAPPSKANHALVDYVAASTSCPRCHMLGPSSQTGSRHCEKCRICSTCCSADLTCSAAPAAPSLPTGGFSFGAPVATSPLPPSFTFGPTPSQPAVLAASASAEKSPTSPTPFISRPMGYAKLIGTPENHNVRNRPSTDGDVVARLRVGDVVPVLEQNKEWFLVGTVPSGWSISAWKGNTRLEFTPLAVEATPLKGTLKPLALATSLSATRLPNAGSECLFKVDMSTQFEVVAKVGEYALIRRTSSPVEEAFVSLASIEIGSPVAPVCVDPVPAPAASSSAAEPASLLPPPSPLTPTTLINILRAAEEIECPIVTKLCLNTFLSHPFEHSDFMALFATESPKCFWSNEELLQLVVDHFDTGRGDQKLLHTAIPQLPLPVITAILSSPKTIFAPLTTFQIAHKWACHAAKKSPSSGGLLKTFAQVQPVCRMNELSVLEIRNEVQLLNLLNDSQLIGLYASAPSTPSPAKPATSVRAQPAPLELPLKTFTQESSRVLHTEEYADIELVFDLPSWTKLRCHKAVLSAFSGFFRSFFESKSETATAATSSFSHLMSSTNSASAPINSAASEKAPALQLTAASSSSSSPVNDSMDETSPSTLTPQGDEQQKPKSLTVTLRKRKEGGFVAYDQVIVSEAPANVFRPILEFMYSNQFQGGLDSSKLVQLLDLSLQMEVPLVQATLLSEIFRTRETITLLLPSLLSVFSSGQASLETIVSARVVDHLSRPLNLGLLFRDSITRHLPGEVFAKCLQARSTLNPLEVLYIALRWINVRAAFLAEKDGGMQDPSVSSDLYKQIQSAMPWDRLTWKQVREHVVPKCKDMLTDEQLCEVFFKSQNASSQPPEVGGNVPDHKRCPGTKVKVLSNSNSNNYRIGTIYVVHSGNSHDSTCRARDPTSGWEGNNLRWSDCCIVEDDPVSRWPWRKTTDFEQPEDFTEYMKMLLRPGVSKVMASVFGSSADGIFEEHNANGTAKVKKSDGSALDVDLKSINILTL